MGGPHALGLHPTRSRRPCFASPALRPLPSVPRPPALSWMPARTITPIKSTSSMARVSRMSEEAQGLPVAPRQIRKMATQAAGGGGGGVGS